MTDRRMTKEQTDALIDIMDGLVSDRDHYAVMRFINEYGYRKPCGTTQE